MTKEFDLIDVILDELGDVARGPLLIEGPGDDAAIVRVPGPNVDAVATTDTLVADVHFPSGAAPELIGYRALAVNLSDLAAMGASPWYCLVASTLPSGDRKWVRRFARGLRLCAEAYGVLIAGGNMAHGPLSITVSAHGTVQRGAGLRRAGARVGDAVYVSGVIGAGGAGLASDDLLEEHDIDQLLGEGIDSDRFPLRRYYLPEPRLALGAALIGVATSAIDISDGLLAELRHLTRASEVGMHVDAAVVPVWRGMAFTAAASAGDDYELLFTAPDDARSLERVRAETDVELTRIGVVTAGGGVNLANLTAGPTPSREGFEHFK